MATATVPGCCRPEPNASQFSFNWKFKLLFPCCAELDSSRIVFEVPSSSSEQCPRARYSPILGASGVWNLGSIRYNYVQRPGVPWDPQTGHIQSHMWPTHKSALSSIKRDKVQATLSLPQTLTKHWTLPEIHCSVYGSAQSPTSSKDYKNLSH